MSPTTAVLPANGARSNGDTVQQPRPGSNSASPSALATAVAERVFQTLVYQDKTPVDMGNSVEVDTFQAFQEAYRREPKDRAELKQFYEHKV